MKTYLNGISNGHRGGSQLTAYFRHDQRAKSEDGPRDKQVSSGFVAGESLFMRIVALTWASADD
jgi:hypothetical protein